MTSVVEVQNELQTTRKTGVSLILTDRQGPEIDRVQAQTLAAFLLSNGLWMINTGGFKSF